MRVGILGNVVLDNDKLKAIADIPSREAVLSQLLGTINEPAARIARVIKNKFNPDTPDTAADETPAETPAAPTE
jgi:large subunit ribosomal protein L10